MKFKIAFIIILWSTTVISQRKKIVYTDENFITITEKTFNEQKNGFYKFKIENDSSIIFVNVKNRKYGRISKQTLYNIKKQLLDISNIKIDSNETIIINYFPAIDKCQGVRDWNSYFLNKVRRYVKVINKKKNVKQFFIFKNNINVKNFKRREKYYIDKGQIIEKVFFNFHYPCFSYVIIRPNGNYYVRRGEYNISIIPEQI